MKIKGLEKLGYGGIAGLGLLLFSLSFLVGNLLPARAELDALQDQKARLVAEAAARDQARGRGGRSGGLPPLAEAPDLLKELSALADRHGVTVTSAAYQLKDRGSLRQLEVSLPLRATYPALRAYLADAMNLAAPAGIADLSLQRPQAGEAGLEGQLRLSFSFAGAP